MKTLAVPIMLGAAMLASGTVHAQSFTYETQWQPAEMLGGFTTSTGPQYRGGVIEGTFTTTYDDGSTDEGSVKCVGMDQPDGGVFAIHMTCNYTGTSGKGTIVYGCNFQGEPGPDTPISCVGGFEGTEGQGKGRRGNITMDWYQQDKASGTGQWFRAGAE